jgi:hypothetical protein
MDDFVHLRRTVMPITLDDFKRAFKTQTERGRVDRLDKQVTEGLKALKTLASQLEGPESHTHSDALVKLVARFALAKKLPTQAMNAIEAQLQQIRKDTLAQVASAVAATRESRSQTDSPSAPVAGDGDASIAESSQVSRAPVDAPHDGSTPTAPADQSVPPVEQSVPPVDRSVPPADQCMPPPADQCRVPADNGVAPAEQNGAPQARPQANSGDRKRQARGQIEQIEQKLRKLASDHGFALR